MTTDPVPELVVMAGLQGSGKSTGCASTWPADDAREGRARVPPGGLYGTAGRFVPPALDEGFDRVEMVPARERGTPRHSRPGGCGRT